MPNNARAYIGSIVTAGLAVLLVAAYQWSCPDAPRFVTYLVLALLASTLKVKLPGITGTYSLSFLFILIGIADFNFAETVMMGCAATIVQCVWRPNKKPTFVQVAFNVANLAISITAAYLAGHTLAQGKIIVPAMMAVAACVFFVVNTVLVSGVLSQLEHKKLKQVWEQWFLWSFPYYLAGAVIASAISISSRYIDWKSSLLILPIMCLIYLYYQLYVGRYTDERLLAKEPLKAA